MVAASHACPQGALEHPCDAPLPCLVSQTVRDKCFEKCVAKPGSSLGSSEQQCLARCSDRYIDVCTLTPSITPRFFIVPSFESFKLLVVYDLRSASQNA